MFINMPCQQPTTTKLHKKMMTNFEIRFIEMMEHIDDEANENEFPIKLLR